MKHKVIKEWVVYLLAGVLYCLAVMKASEYSELDAVIVWASATAMLVAGYWIQRTDHVNDVRKAYERGIRDASKAIWKKSSLKPYCDNEDE